MPTFYALQPDYITALNGLVDGTGIHTAMRIGAGAPAMPAGVQLFVYGGASAAAMRLNGPRAWDILSGTGSKLEVWDATGGGQVANFGFGGIGFSDSMTLFAPSAGTNPAALFGSLALVNTDTTVGNFVQMRVHDGVGVGASLAFVFTAHGGSAQADAVFYGRNAGGTFAERYRMLSQGGGIRCWDTGGTHYIQWSGTTATTVGAAGGGSALPATPVGYALINVDGTDRKVPYYNV
jgi:hypothetical protein